MLGFTQHARMLTVATPLGADVLLMEGFSGSESISGLFRFQLDLLSEREGIAPQDLVGQPIGWAVRHADREPRHFHGIVNRFAAGPPGERGLWRYQVEVVPWLWFLTRTTDCRIFQNKTTPQIVKTIFEERGFRDFDLSGVRGEHATWEYCVQYRETAFNFVSRLLEHEGIFYFFEHTEDRHTLVLADRRAAFVECRESRVNYSRGSLAPNHVHDWQHTYEFRSGRWTRTDYNFQTPQTNLLTTTDAGIDLPRIDQYELFDYPGIYRVKGEGEPLTRTRMEEEEAHHDVVRGESACCTFTPGGRFELANHDVPSEVGGYIITSIEHSASESSYGPSASGSSYSNTFTCIPDSANYRPPRRTPKPRIDGPQTAVVVGPAGEEIYTDKFGRIKVQFHWDRRGKRDENSSCWMRVAQFAAGGGFGAVHIPRVGHEVVVSFEEGDPDRPLVTGCVYNASKMPAYGLPGKKTLSGLRSNTYPGGGGNNEITVDDTKGAERMYLHAQYDQDTVIGHNRTVKVGLDSFEEVANNLTRSVGVNESVQVGNNRTETVGSNLVLTAGTSITLKCGASTIHMNQAGFITITGTVVTMAGSVNANVAAPLTNVAGAVMLTNTGALNLVNGVVTRVEGSNLGHFGGGKAELIGGETLVQGGTVKIN